METDTNTQDLRYLDAESVRFAAGNLSGFKVCTEDAESLGSVGGVLISPSSRQLCYLVVQKPGLLTHRCYLVSPAGATIQQDRKMLQVGGTREDLHLESFDPRSVQEFSDDDLLETLFSRAS